MFGRFLLSAAIPICGLLASPAVAGDWRELPDLPPMPAPADSGRVSHEGASLYYAIYGSGEPVLLLHGGLADGDYWANQVLPLAKGHKVIVVDSRGHGRSTRDGRPFSYDLMESDALAVMDALKVDRAAVVGWSDGAIVGLVMAMKDPGRVTKVYAFAPNVDVSGVNFEATTRAPFPDFLAQAADEYARTSPTPRDFPALEAALGRMWEAEPNYSEADLAKIGVPVDVVRGGNDEVIKPTHLRYVALAIPSARLEVIPGVSHFGMLQDPAAFDASIQSFLDAR